MSKMIPLHIADAAVAACEKEIQELRAENARLKAEVELLTRQRDNLDFWLTDAIREEPKTDA